MSLVLAVDARGFEQLVAKLHKIEARIPSAIALGLNEGGDKVRTQVQRALQQQSGLLRYGSVTKRVGTVRAFASGAPKSGVGPVQPHAFGGDGLAYSIVVSGKPTKIYDYAHAVKTGPGGFVSAKLWGVDHVFARSFQIKGSEGGKGLRARTQPARLPIRGFDGANLAKELSKGIVPGRLKEGAEGRDVHPVRHGLDVGPGAFRLQSVAEGVAVVGAVGEQDVAWADAAQHVGGAAAVMGLALGQLEGNREAVGVHQGVDLGGQAAARAPHALGSSVVPSGGRRGVQAPFLPLPPCWCTRIEDESTICRSPSYALEIASKMRSHTPTFAQRRNRFAQVVAGP